MEPVGFSDAVLEGLAPDGGLILPESIPHVSDRLTLWQDLDYADLAFEIINLYSDLPEDALRDIVQRTYAVFDDAEVTPLVKIGDLHLLELFHGPTLAFKDIALQFLGNLFEYLLAERGGTMNIVGATSGDTGSAAIYGVRGRERIRIFILYPDGRVSPVQEMQMCTVPDANVHCLAVDGTFDDCQAMVKELFGDLEMKSRFALGAVNSINWARVLAQVVYYFYAGLRVMREEGLARVSFSVPTGNFGDVFAGYLAHRMGLPIDRLIVATNENDILTRFFEAGDYSQADVHSTLSPSMDIQIASNFERYLYYRAGESGERVSELMRGLASTGRIAGEGLDPAPEDDPLVAGRADRAATLQTIRDVHARDGYVLDPHSAVGVSVAQARGDAAHTICLATAHPAKFPDAIREATGEDLGRHARVDALRGASLRRTPLEAQTDALRGHIEQEVEKRNT